MPALSRGRKSAARGRDGCRLSRSRGRWAGCVAMNGSGRKALIVSRPMRNAREPRRGTKDDDKPYVRAPDRGAAIDRLRRRHDKGAHRMITISAFKWVPEFAHGQVRDLRAR